MKKQKTMVDKQFLSDLEKGFKANKFSETKALRSFIVDENPEFDLGLSPVFESVKMPLYKRVVLKEKLMLAQNINLRSFDWKTLFQSMAAGFVALSLVITSVLDIGGAQVAKASSPISVAGVSGDVKVVRLGNELDLYPGFNINPSDKIKTYSGFVELIFEDTSVLRVDKSSEVIVDEIKSFDGRTDSTLSVKSGSVWFNAFGGGNRLSEYNFKTSDLLVEIDDDSVINLEANELYGQVSVFDESAEVNYRKDGEFERSVLRKGDLIKVKREQGSVSVIDSVLLANQMESSERNWYLDNLKKDRIYEASLLENRLLASKEKVKITSDSLWYPLKEAQRATKLALTMDPVKKAEVELEIADEKLHEAQILAVEGKSELAEKAIEDYKKNVSNVLKVADEVGKNSDIENSTKLKVDAKNMVESHKSVVSSNVETLPLKQALKDTELQLAEVSGDKVKVKLKQLDEEIDEIVKEVGKSNVASIDVEEPVVSGNEKLEKVIVDFTKVVEEASMELDRDEDVSKLINEQVIELKQLKEQAQVVNPELDEELENTLKKVGIEDTEDVEGVLEPELDGEEDVVKSKIEIDELDLVLDQEELLEVTEKVEIVDDLNDDLLEATEE